MWVHGQEFTLVYLTALYIFYIITYLFTYYKNLTLVPQSGTVGFIESPDVGTNDHSMEPDYDEMRTASNINDTDLGRFLSRPILIHQLSWDINANPYTSINPWHLFLTNKRVYNRINNFTLIRGNLNIKVTCNGNSFYYGRLMISYNPLAIYDQYLSNTTLFLDSVRLSQRPHIMVDPALNMGGEIKATFMWMYDYLDINYIDTVSEALGSLTIRTIADLQQANDSTSTVPVTVSIFAWMDEVELAGVTNTNASGLVPQSGDEYGMKPSNILNTAAQFVAPVVASGLLSPYMRATEIVLRASSNVAKMLGFCKPVDIDEAKRYKPTPVGVLATVEGPDLSAKLTLDPKQELAIDPSIWGCNEADPMSILEIAKKPSLVDKFLWSNTHTPDTMVWNMLVDPAVVPDRTRPTLSAVGAMTLPFDYWSGNLRITLEVVASQFHKGRLAVVYDCFETPAALELNTNYVQILDITEQRKISFDIGNMQDSALRKHYRPGDPADSALDPMSTTRITRSIIDSLHGSGEVGNGTLSVWVVNSLTSPKAGVSDVQVLVYLEAGDDFRVYSPNDDINDYSYVVPQSGIDTGTTNPVTKDPPTHTIYIRGKQPSIAKVYCGEHIHSLRALVKRYTSYLHFKTEATNPTGLSIVRLGIYPVTKFYGGGPTLHSDAVLTPINYVTHTYLSYFRPMFAIMRGSTRYKLLPTVSQVPGASTEPAAIVVSRIDNNNIAAQDVTPHLVQDLALDYTNESALAFSWETKVAAPKLSGSALTVKGVNPTLEFEIPYYANRRFSVGPSSDGIGGSSGFVGGAQLAFNITAMGLSNVLWCAAGEDFTYGFFFGQPEITSWFDGTPNPAP